MYYTSLAFQNLRNFIEETRGIEFAEEVIPSDFLASLAPIGFSGKPCGQGHISSSKQCRIGSSLSAGEEDTSWTKASNTVETRKRLAELDISSYVLKDSAGRMEAGAGAIKGVGGLKNLFYAGWDEVDLMSMGFFEKPDEPWTWLDEDRNDMKNIKWKIDEKNRIIVNLS